VLLDINGRYLGGKHGTTEAKDCPDKQIVLDVLGNWTGSTPHESEAGLPFAPISGLNSTVLRIDVTRGAGQSDGRAANGERRRPARVLRVPKINIIPAHCRHSTVSSRNQHDGSQASSYGPTAGKPVSIDLGAGQWGLVWVCSAILGHRQDEVGEGPINCLIYYAPQHPSTPFLPSWPIVASGPVEGRRCNCGAKSP
jgi:hypothetical protein